MGFLFGIKVLQVTKVYEKLLKKKKQPPKPNNTARTSLVAQWLGIHLPAQGTQIRSLVHEDPTRLRATKPESTITEPLP